MKALNLIWIIPISFILGLVSSVFLSDNAITFDTTPELVELINTLDSLNFSCDVNNYNNITNIGFQGNHCYTEDDFECNDIGGSEMMETCYIIKNKNVKLV